MWAISSTKSAVLQVVAVDMAAYPPSYGVMIGDSIRETEASRLKTRGSIKTHPAELQQPVPPVTQHAYTAHPAGRDFV